MNVYAYFFDSSSIIKGNYVRKGDLDFQPILLYFKDDVFKAAYFPTLNGKIVDIRNLNYNWKENYFISPFEIDQSIPFSNNDIFMEYIDITTPYGLQYRYYFTEEILKYPAINTEHPLNSKVGNLVLIN